MASKEEEEKLQAKLDALLAGNAEVDAGGSDQVMGDGKEDSQGRNNMDFYDLLGVGKKASKKEIKKAYRSKALSMHPDRIQKQGRKVSKKDEQLFHDLTFAYETLMNDNLRSMYDLYGKSAIDGKLRIDITKINLMELFDTLYDEPEEKLYPPKIYSVTRYDQNALKQGLFVCLFVLWNFLQLS